MADQSQIVRVTANFPIRVWDEVVRMAQADAITKTEALRRCISTEVFRRQIEAEGARLVVQMPDGTLQRVRFPY